MSYQVRLTSHAESELVSSAIWWAEHRSAEQALRWLDGIRLPTGDRHRFGEREEAKSCSRTKVRAMRHVPLKTADAVRDAPRYAGLEQAAVD